MGSLEPLSVSVFFGLVSMLLWGLYDFAAKLVLRNHDSFKVLLFTQLSGSAFLIAYFARFVDPHVAKPEWTLSLVIAATLYTTGYWGLLKAFKLGELSVVSPVAAGSSALTAALGVWLLGERLAPVVVLGVVLAIVGILMISIQRNQSPRVPTRKSIPSGVQYALITLFSWGLLYVLLKILDRTIEPLSVVVMTRAFAMVLLLSAVLIAPVRRTLGATKTGIAIVFFLMGAIDVAAMVSVNFGLAYGLVAVVSPISSAYPVVSITLALAVLRERPSRFQTIGIANVVASIILLSTTAQQ